jgi:hypothetical protein
MSTAYMELKLKPLIAVGILVRRAVIVLPIARGAVR